MARKVFYSFNFSPDSHRVAQIKNMGVVEGQPLLSSNQWEEVKEGGDANIEKWIDTEMTGKSCAVVLVGSSTAGRRWVKHEIKKAWEDGKGVLGVYIHNLKNLAGEQTTKGTNPFSAFSIDDDGTLMSTVVKCIDPPYKESTNVYKYVEENLAQWVEDAIAIRKAN
jgi:hypothetical protein